MKTLLFILSLSLSAFSQDYSLASPSEISSRAEDAQTHLKKTEGGSLLLESINAHGGLEKWFSNGLLKFRWVYNMTDMGKVVDTTQTIDTWSSRALHSVNGVDTPVSFGWDGKSGWVTPKDAQLLVPPSFWALTPYYFVGVPHVLADPGTIHEKIEDITFQGKNYHQVKVTYEANTGETPDDYYITLIDPETKLVKGVRYIVTDQRVTRGKPATPEKLLTYEGWYDLNGVLFPKKHVTHTMEGNVIGAQMRHADVLEAEFLGEKEISFSASK